MTASQVFGDEKSGDRLEANDLLKFHVYRRELYNSLSQAAGWTGMVQFFKTHEAELDALHSGLAKIYEDLHFAYRYATILSLEQQMI